MGSALARRRVQEPPALLRVEEAQKLLARCTRFEEVKQIRDQAAAVRLYLREQGAARAALNDAGEIKLRSERRLGVLLELQKKTGGRATQGSHRKKSQPASSSPPPTLDELGISKDSASRWQQVAKVPEAKFETFVRAQREHPAGEVTTAGLIRVAKSKDPHAASRVNDGDPHKNDKFTRRVLVELLHQRFRFTVDAFGHPLSPASQIIGRWYTVEDDAFEQSFVGDLPFSNSPWDLLAEAVRLTHEQVEAGCKRWVHLMPANRTEQAWWHKYIEPYRPDRGGCGVRVEMIEGRESYGNPDDPEGLDSDQPNMPSCLVIWEGPRQRGEAWVTTGAELPSQTKRRRRAG